MKFNKIPFAVLAISGILVGLPEYGAADLMNSPTVEASPSSPIRGKVKDDELALFLNMSNNSLYGLDNWANRSVEAIIDHPPFRLKVEQMLEELLDDPDTAWHDPLLDMQVELPLFGLFNIGLHFQDIWSGTEATATTRGPCNYPNTGVYATCVKAAARFADPATSHSAVTINWSQVHGTISIQPGTLTNGAADGAATNMPATSPTSALANGAINITLTLGDVYLDTILRKPDFPAEPTNTDTGNYVHALGRLRIMAPTTLTVRIYTIGGKFAGTSTISNISGGYGIGIDFQGITFSGGLQLDLDEFDCTYNRGNTSDLGTAHPQWAYQWARDDEGMCYLRSDHTTTTGGACFSTKATGVDLAAPNKDASCTGAVASPWKYYIDAVGPAGSYHPDLEVAECDGADGTVPNAACTIPAPAAGAFAAAPEILASHRNKSNERSDYIAEIIQFLEGQVFLDMQQNSLPAAVRSYLTAIEITDTTWLTHERDADSIINPIVFEHPIETGNNILIDYGFFYRFAGVNSGGQVGAFIPGGFAAAVTQYNNPLPHCATVPGAGSATPVVNSHGRIEMNSLWTAPMGYGSTAMLGLSVHSDPLNQLLDNLWRSKLLCMNIWKGSGAVGDFLGDILNVDTFKMFMPSLLTSLGGNDMAIRLKPRYTKISTGTYVQANDQPQITWEPGNPPRMLNPSSTGLWDIKIALPHLETIFAVDANQTNTTYLVKNFTDLFSADVSVNAYLDAAWYSLSAAGWGTKPDAPCNAAPYPCRIGRLGFHLDAFVNEITDQTTFPAGITAYDPDTLKGALGSLLAIAMAGEYEGNLEVHINTDPTNVSFLGLVIDPVLPGTTGVLGADAGLGGINSDGTSSPVANDYFGGFFKIADMDSDGFSDTLDPQMVVDLLTDAGILPASPGLDRPVGYDPFAKYRTNYKGPIHVAPETMVRLVDDSGAVIIGDSIELSAAQTKAMGIGSRGGVIYLASDSVETTPENLVTQYKIDRGFFSLRMLSDRIELPYQFDGRHTIQIWSSDDKGFMDATPAVIKYVVDTQAPRLKWMSEASVRSASYRRELSVRDAVSTLDAIQLSYRVDGGEWVAMPGSQELYVDSLGDGAHSIEVRAVDENGNTSVLSDAVYVAEGQGFGCSAASSSQSSSLSFVMMLLVMCAGYAGLRWRKQVE